MIGKNLVSITAQTQSLTNPYLLCLLDQNISSLTKTSIFRESQEMSVTVRTTLGKEGFITNPGQLHKRLQALCLRQGLQSSQQQRQTDFNQKYCSKNTDASFNDP
jgi:hypothetical protein